MTLKSGFVPRDDENTVFMYVGHLAEIEKKRKKERRNCPDGKIHQPIDSPAASSSIRLNLLKRPNESAADRLRCAA